jgi:hypothetical protein
MNTRANGAQLGVSAGAALYVDTENLRESDHARQVVASVIANWPGDRPPLGSVSLYVRADKAELWRLWAEGTFPGLRLRVRGVQHFSNTKAKNSADLAITADAVADLVTGHAVAVAVVSNDSDFGALFVKVRELAHEANADIVPFLWITAPDGGTLSAEIAEFIPATFRWDLSTALNASETVVPAPASVVSKRAPQPLPQAARAALAAATSESTVSNQTMAEELLLQLPLGRFRASDAQEVISRRWPEHPAAGDTARFGQFLGKEIWPILQKRGVVMTRKSSPRTYEITPAAKETIGEGALTQPAQSPPDQPDAEATLDDLAATVAAGITDDIFKASEAQKALQARQPRHPAASYTAAQFGTWFAKQLWPVMEKHGVAIAKEKPRLYEMTPDARHRLTSLV